MLQPLFSMQKMKHYVLFYTDFDKSGYTGIS